LFYCTADVTITITRTHGTFGKVEVRYKTLTPQEKPSFIPALVSRANENDFRASEGTVIFSEGQTEGTFSIMIMDDNEPENDESLFVQLTGVSVVTPAQTRTGEILTVFIISFQRLRQIDNMSLYCQ